jgi:hypothetical protein
MIGQHRGKIGGKAIMRLAVEIDDAVSIASIDIPSRPAIDKVLEAVREADARGIEH